MPLCPISEIPALHSLGLWPKLVALQILRRSQKIREAPTESPFVVSTLCSLHCLWQERALSTEICVCCECYMDSWNSVWDIYFPNVSTSLLHAFWYMDHGSAFNSLCSQNCHLPLRTPPRHFLWNVASWRNMKKKNIGPHTPSFRGILFLKLAGPRRARWSRRQCSGGPSCQEKWELMGINNMFGANLYKVGQGWNMFPISRLYLIGIFVTNLSWNIQRQILVQ